jgi:hypothetical protein
MSVEAKTVYNIEVQLTSAQYNILAVALDHMWEHLNDIRDEDGYADEMTSNRMTELSEMQLMLKV